MGQIQLLLIVLGIIIIGIAVMIGMSTFHHQAASANLDRVASFIGELGARAQKHYRTPIWMGGGGHSFEMLTADAQGMALLTNIATNEIGTFTILVPGSVSSVILQGVGVEDGDGDGVNCTVECQVFVDNIVTTIVNR